MTSFCVHWRRSYAIDFSVWFQPGNSGRRWLDSCESSRSCQQRKGMLLFLGGNFGLCGSGKWKISQLSTTVLRHTFVPFWGFPTDFVLTNEEHGPKKLFHWYKFFIAECNENASVYADTLSITLLEPSQLFWTVSSIWNMKVPALELFKYRIVGI